MLGLGSSLTTGGAFAPERVLIASYSFDTSGSLPSGWQSGVSSAHTLYGSVTSDTSNFWTNRTANTPSSFTGPGGGHVAGPDTLDTVVTDGTWDNSSDYRYYHYEATGQGNANDANSERSSLRTNELDFSAYASVEMTLWFHAASFGSHDHFVSNDGSGTPPPLGFGIACTTSASSASSAAQSGTGLGFTSDIAGGATAVYTNLSGTVVSTVRLAHNGAVQSSGHTSGLADGNKWIKATIDLSNAAGQSSNYIYFTYFTHYNGTGNWYAQDFAFDSVSIIGTKQ